MTWMSRGHGQQGSGNQGRLASPGEELGWGSGFFHLLFPKSYLSQTQGFLGWGFSIDIWGKANLSVSRSFEKT